jgi:hypothetical protein
VKLKNEINDDGDDETVSEDIKNYFISCSSSLNCGGAIYSENLFYSCDSVLFKNCTSFKNGSEVYINIVDNIIPPSFNNFYFINCSCFENENNPESQGEGGGIFSFVSIYCENLTFIKCNSLLGGGIQCQKLSSVCLIGVRLQSEEVFFVIHLQLTITIKFKRMRMMSYFQKKKQFL